jgi:hypothetical protein
MEKLMLLIGTLGILLLISFLLSWPVYMLWNGCLVDAINGINEVTWLQAWGLTVLCGLMFKTTVNHKE